MTLPSVPFGLLTREFVQLWISRLSLFDRFLTLSCHSLILLLVLPYPQCLRIPFSKSSRLMITSDPFMTTLETTLHPVTTRNILGKVILQSLFSEWIYPTLLLHSTLSYLLFIEKTQVESGPRLFTPPSISFAPSTTPTKPANNIWTDNNTKDTINYSY